MHGDLRLVLSRCSWPSPRAFALSWLCWSGMISLHCAAAPFHWVIDTGGANPMFIKRSLFERCVTLPVGRWSVAQKQLIRSVGGMVRSITISYFERKETKFDATRQPFMVEIALLFVFFLSNSLVFVSFLSLSDRSYTQDQAASMPSTQAVAPSLSHATTETGVRRCEHWTKEPIAANRKPFGRQRFVSVLWLHHAQLRDLVEVWALTGECSSPVRGYSPPDWNRSIFFVQTFVDFALSLPWHSLSVCLHPGRWFFFSETTNTDKKWKLVPIARLPP